MGRVSKECEVPAALREQNADGAHDDRRSDGGERAELDAAGGALARTGRRRARGRRGGGRDDGGSVPLDPVRVEEGVHDGRVD